MLKRSFIHIPGINEEIEKQIWQSNVHSWTNFLENHASVSLSSTKKEQITSYIHQSLQAYDNQEHSFFFDNMPPKQQWRLYGHFKCCFLDIETTGLSKYNDDLTVIGLYNGRESKIFINGKNLDQFAEEIKKYDLIVTFNGKCFDVPFLKAKFPRLDLDKPHLDLRYLMKDIGYVGGLKRIEREVGICRDDDLQDISGFDAVRLWYKYKKGDEEALKLLVKYNIADIENLKTLMEFAYDKLKQKCLNNNC